MIKLADILRAAFIHSQAGQRPDALRASLGGTHRDTFDFNVMSRLVARNVPKDELPAARRRRIEARARGPAGAALLCRIRGSPTRPDAPASFGFRYDDCAGAAAAYRERLPKLAEVVKAISVAELEAERRLSRSRARRRSSPVSTSVRFRPTTSRCSPITSCASRRIGPMPRRTPA